MTLEQRQQMTAFLGDLYPMIPVNITLEPWWEEAFGTWILWAHGICLTAPILYLQLIENSKTLANLHGIEVILAPFEAKPPD